MSDNSVEMMPSRCPSCGHKVNRASHSSMTEKHEPRKGDLSLCIACGAIGVYADYLGTVRKITPDELRTLQDDAEACAEIQKLQTAIRVLHAKNSRFVGTRLP